MIEKQKERKERKTLWLAAGGGGGCLLGNYLSLVPVSVFVCVSFGAAPRSSVLTDWIESGRGIVDFVLGEG